MNIPFSFGKIVREDDFTDRRQETAKLLANIHALTNTAIISPRRWGKSSLVNKVVDIVSEDSGYMIVRMNVFKCDDEQEFYALFAKSVMEQISSSVEALIANSREFLSHLLPKVSFSDPLSRYEISFGLDVVKNPIPEDILDLPQRIAARRGKKVVVCIDEFQQIGEFSNSSRFQKILRSHWQEQTDVAYILYGSKKHMMLNIFGEYKSPFYKFGDIMFLPKISKADWQDYIVSRFRDTGKNIQSDIAGYIAQMVDNHPYYVQQLAQLSWLRCESECTVETVDSALSSMLDALNLQFIGIMDTLTDKQRNFLCALADGVVQLTAERTLTTYKLGTNGNVRIIRNALLKRDMIDVEGKSVQIQDPVFKLWLQRQYSVLN
ncbi:MAG: ATP-binding protein [Candidatus Cryptobacteroides sp.]